MSDDRPPRLRSPGSFSDGRDQEDVGHPFALIFGSDTPVTLAARVYEQMRLIWGEQKTRAAFGSVIKRERGGRPASTVIQPNDQHMLDVYDLWSTVPGNDRKQKLKFSKYWIEKNGITRQSPDAVTKKLNRLLKVRGRKPIV